MKEKVNTYLKLQRMICDEANPDYHWHKDKKGVRSLPPSLSLTHNRQKKSRGVTLTRKHHFQKSCKVSKKARKSKYTLNSWQRLRIGRETYLSSLPLIPVWTPCLSIHQASPEESVFYSWIEDFSSSTVCGYLLFNYTFQNLPSSFNRSRSDLKTSELTHCVYEAVMLYVM